MSRPVIFVATHLIPFPPGAGNEVRVARLIEWLESSGFAVALFINPLDQKRLGRRRLAELERRVSWVYVIGHERLQNRCLRDLDERILEPLRYRLKWLLLRVGGMPDFGWQKRARARPPADLFCPPEMLHELARRYVEHRPRAVIAEYVFMTRCFEATPHALKIVDTHDLFSARREKLSSHGIVDRHAISRRDEAARLRRADLILAIQDEERRAFSELCPEVPAITVGVDDRVLAANPREEIPGRVLYVGSDNEINARALADFLARAWPAVRRRVPHAHLRVVGRVARRCPSGVTGVERVGFVEDVAREYGKSQVVINPAMVGSGLKIKSLEAFSFGKPLVSFADGVIGLERAPAPYLLADDWEGFARHLGDVLSSANLRGELADRATALARERFAPEVVYAELWRWLSPGATTTVSRIASR